MNIDNEDDNEESLEGESLDEALIHKSDDINTESSFDDSSGGVSDDAFTDLKAAPDQQNRKNLEILYEEKLKHLRRYYSDEYIELFRETFQGDNDDHGTSTGYLSSTQLGAVIWQADEKKKLYNVLSRRGRHDLPSIANAVQTKSELEVRDYLLFLRREEIGRHLFEVETKSISHADIPAALEIGEECESALEKAADALAAFQDQFDNAVAKRNIAMPWIIDPHLAASLDLEADESEGEVSSSSREIGVTAATQLLRLSNLLDLSEKLFMNRGPARSETNWRSFALKGERPSLTQKFVSDIHDLVTSLTRKLMQTALFLATSRLKSSKGTWYAVRPLVKRQDVSAALEVLNIKADLWDYWIWVARRNRLEVVGSSHQKGSSRKQSLSFDAVEKALGVRASRGRRRSLSVITDTSSTNENGLESDIEMSVVIQGKPQPNTTSSSNSSNGESQMDESNSTSDHSASGESGDNDVDIISFHASTSKQKRRQIYLDHQQDLFLEGLDRAESQREEARIMQALQSENEIPVKQEPESKHLGDRPKVLRKAKDDLRDWVITYQAEWERFGEMVPQESFVETEGGRKRRRTEA